MAHHKAKSVPKGMERHLEDRITSENLVPITSLEELARGCILNCRSEGKSPATISTYDERLRRFCWYCREQRFPDEPQKLRSQQVRSFLWYLASERDQWGGESVASRNPAIQSTVNRYYRVGNTFFGWLKKEGFIADNPVAHLKAPKIDHTPYKSVDSSLYLLSRDNCQ